MKVKLPKKQLIALKNKMLKVKKIPQRKCVGCEEIKNKKEMLRIVRSPEGEISLDKTGKKNGRGAYVCPTKECITLAVKQKGLERGLKTSVDPEILGRLLEELDNGE